MGTKSNINMFQLPNKVTMIHFIKMSKIFHIYDFFFSHYSHWCSNLIVTTLTTTFAIFFATEGKILVEDIVKLGSEIEDADTAEAGKS